MAFAGAAQRWHRLRVRAVMALNGLYVGGTDSTNRVKEFLVGSKSETSSDLTVGAGDQEKVEVTVTGAALGDIVIVAIDKDHADMIVSGYVSAADTVQVLVHNETAGSLTISQPYDINVLVIKV